MAALAPGARVVGDPGHPRPPRSLRRARGRCSGASARRSSASGRGRCPRRWRRWRRPAASAAARGSTPASRPTAGSPTARRCRGAGWALKAVHTPGASRRSPELRLGRRRGAVLRRYGDGLGDDADLAAGRRPAATFWPACAGCRGAGETVYLPGHGAPVRDPQAMIAWQLAHRAEREAQIRAALASGPATVPQLVARVYPDLATGAAAGGGAHGAGAPDRPGRARPRAQRWRLPADAVLRLGLRGVTRCYAGQVVENHT